MLKKDTYTILPDGEFLIESLIRMGIRMDKYKTSELGKALKKVFHGEYTIQDSIIIAEKEISEVFCKKELPPEQDMDDGFVGDIAGKCPLCGREVRRTSFGYGCSGYRDGCRFSVNGIICNRVISLKNIQKLLLDGETYKIQGFISKRTGKEFDAKLKLQDGRAVFDFS